MIDLDHRNFVPRFYLESNGLIGESARIVDRRTDTGIPVTLDSSEVVAVMVRLGITVIEIDAVGMSLPLVQTLKEWGGITVITTRQGVPVG